MSDLAAWGVIAGMAGYGFAVLGLVRLVARRRARRRPDAAAPRPVPGGTAGPVQPSPVQPSPVQPSPVEASAG